MSSEACPRTLRYICACLQRDVQNRCVYIVGFSLDFFLPRWPQERLVKTRVVSGFIFLRLLCPAILNPRQVWKLVIFHHHCLFNTRANKLGSYLVHFHCQALSFVFTFSFFTCIFLQFGLLSEPVPPPAMRSLVMIAKCLQVIPAFILKCYSSFYCFRILQIWWNLEERNPIWRCYYKSVLFSAFYTFNQRTLLWNWS